MLTLRKPIAAILSMLMLISSSVVFTAAKEVEQKMDEVLLYAIENCRKPNENIGVGINLDLHCERKNVTDMPSYPTNEDYRNAKETKDFTAYYQKSSQASQELKAYYKQYADPMLENLVKEFALDVVQQDLYGYHVWAYVKAGDVNKLAAHKDVKNLFFASMLTAEADEEYNDIMAILHPEDYECRFCGGIRCTADHSAEIAAERTAVKAEIEKDCCIFCGDKFCTKDHSGEIVEYHPDDSLVVTIIDATTIQRYLAQLVAPDDAECIDYDNDGAITILDATTIQKVLAGLV